jgi:putative membrane protein
MAETVADRRLHPSTLFIRFVKQAPEFLVGLPALISFASNFGVGRFLAIAAVGGSLSFGFSLLAWLRFRYGIGERDFVIESGVLNRQRRVIPFDRVQDIDIEQRFLARLFGAAKVRIETGGAGRNEGDLDTVTLAEAHRLRDIIRGAAPGDAGIGAGEALEPVLFEMNVRRLFAAGLFNFSLFYLAVIAGAFQYLQPILKRRLPDPKDWAAPDVGQVANLSLYVTLVIAVIVLLLGVVTGVLRTVARDYRFRLTRAPSGFRRQRGLFTLSEVIIPLRRVQLAVVGTGWLRKRLGWYDLQFQTLSADAQQSGHQAAAPFATMAEVEPILKEAGIAELVQPGEYVAVSRLAILRRFLGTIIPLAAMAALASLLWPPALLGLIPVGLGAVLVVLNWRRHRYALRDRAIYVAEGFLRPRLWILPYAKAQTIGITRSPLQRHFGLATVEIDTAGASLFHYPQVRDLDRADAEALAARLLDEYYRARQTARPRPGGEWGIDGPEPDENIR